MVVCSRVWNWSAFLRERERLAEMDAFVSFTERLRTLELSVKSPCVHLIFGPAFTTYLLFQWYQQSKEI